MIDTALVVCGICTLNLLESGAIYTFRKFYTHRLRQNLVWIILKKLKVPYVLVSHTTVRTIVLSVLLPTPNPII